MTDRPIIFSGSNVRALLEGRKTQTRRLATSIWRKAAPGDRLWVREAVACGACAKGPPSHWAPSFWRREQGTPENPTGLWYRADDLAPAYAITPRGRWVPPIHMPRWASRLTLALSEVRIERLQDISEADARAEGIVDVGIGYRRFPGDRVLYGSARRAFQDLWDDLHGAGAWERNPEVVALTFPVAEHRNIDHA